MNEIDVQWILRYVYLMTLLGGSTIYVILANNPTYLFTQLWLTLFTISYCTAHIIFRRDPWDGLTDEGVNELTDNNPQRETLERWMETEKPYLNPDFKLMDLRAVLPLNRTYLSQLISSEYGCTFYQFVANYRVDEAKRLMAAHPDMKMQEVADRSGFASQSTFTHTFSKMVGMSPREWCRNFNHSMSNIGE